MGSVWENVQPYMPRSKLQSCTIADSWWISNSRIGMPWLFNPPRRNQSRNHGSIYCNVNKNLSNFPIQSRAFNYSHDPSEMRFGFGWKPFKEAFGRLKMLPVLFPFAFNGVAENPVRSSVHHVDSFLRRRTGKRKLPLQRSTQVICLKWKDAHRFK